MGGARWRGFRVRKVLCDPEAEGTSLAAPEGLYPQGAEDASRLEPEDRDPQSLCKASDRPACRRQGQSAPGTPPCYLTSNSQLGGRKGRDRRSSGGSARIRDLETRRRFERAARGSTNRQFAAWRPRAARRFHNRAARFGPPAEGGRCFATAISQSGAHSVERIQIHDATTPALSMNASAAIVDSLLRQACTRLARRAGGRARRSVPRRTVSSTLQSFAAPRARLATRLRDFATNRHEYCGLSTAQTRLRR